MAKKDYGGAYDIEPEQYWSRDDLNELQETIDNLISDISAEFEIEDIYLNDNVFDIDYIWEMNHIHLEEQIKVDMRSAKTTQELCQVYAPIIVKAIEAQIDRTEKELDDERDDDWMHNGDEY